MPRESSECAGRWPELPAGLSITTSQRRGQRRDDPCPARGDQQAAHRASSPCAARLAALTFAGGIGQVGTVRLARVRPASSARARPRAGQRSRMEARRETVPSERRSAGPMKSRCRSINTSAVARVQRVVEGLCRNAHHHAARLGSADGVTMPAHMRAPCGGRSDRPGFEHERPELITAIGPTVPALVEASLTAQRPALASTCSKRA